MSNFLQLSVKLLVCGYSGAFQLYEQLSELVKIRFQKRRSKTEGLERNSQGTRPKNGKVVEQLWNNLKKMLSKRRPKLKEVDVSVVSDVWW